LIALFFIVESWLPFFEEGIDAFFSVWGTEARCSA